MSETRVAPPQTEQAGRESGIGDWLTLQEASALLNVAPSTVRRWADAGRISTRRTEGGHRRFEATAVHALRSRAARTQGASTLAPSLERVASQPWHAHFAGAAVAGEMRTLGQRLLGLLIQYLIWQGDNERFLDDGRQIGARYGQVARDAGVPMRETMQAFLFFRRTFWRTALQAPAVAQVSDVAEVMRIAERIDHFMNEVLFSTLSAYE
jgi:excisionase family DNA binding protein